MRRSKKTEATKNKATVEVAAGDDLRPEYDETLLKNGIRGKYAERYKRGTNVVKLAPDVAAAFPTEEAVNTALRSLIKDHRQAT